MTKDELVTTLRGKFADVINVRQSLPENGDYRFYTADCFEDAGNEQRILHPVGFTVYREGLPDERAFWMGNQPTLYSERQLIARATQAYLAVHPEFADAFLVEVNEARRTAQAWVVSAGVESKILLTVDQLGNVSHSAITTVVRTR